MSSTAKHRSTLLGASLGVAGTVALVVVLGLAAGAGASGAATPPSNTSPPTISGTAQKGQTLHAEPGSWNGSKPMSFAYRWQRCNKNGAGCSNIAGATRHDYTLGSADVGNTVRVVVTASNSAGSASAASSPTAVIAAPQAPANTVPPSISGTPQLGQTLTANPGAGPGRNRSRSRTSGSGVTRTAGPAATSPAERARRTCSPRRRRPRHACPRPGEEPVRRDLGDHGADRRGLGNPRTAARSARTSSTSRRWACRHGWSSTACTSRR